MHRLPQEHSSHGQNPDDDASQYKFERRMPMDSLRMRCWGNFRIRHILLGSQSRVFELGVVGVLRPVKLWNVGARREGDSQFF
jgi:hypothetical protein